MDEDKIVWECIQVEKEMGGKEQEKSFQNPEIQEITSVKGVCESAFEKIIGNVGRKAGQSGDMEVMEEKKY